MQSVSPIYITGVMVSNVFELKSEGEFCPINVAAIFASKHGIICLIYIATCSVLIPV